MKRFLAGLAVVGLLAIASPAQAATFTQAKVTQNHPLFETTEHADTSDITASITWAKMNRSAYFYVYNITTDADGNVTGDPNQGCIVVLTTNGGSGSCTISPADAGTYRVEVLTSGSVSGVSVTVS